MSRINLDLQALAAFLEVADCASFRAASQRLHLSAPATSRRVDRLERMLGVRLLERSTRHVALTPAGRAFMQQARQALDKLERAALGIQSVSRRHSGIVTIACVPSTVSTLVSRMLRLLSEQLPGVQFRLLDTTEGEVTGNVIRGKADFGIGFLSQETPEIDFTPLARDPYVAAVHRSHALATRKRLGWDRLRQEALITVSRSSGNRPFVDQLLQAGGDAPPVFIEVNRVSTVLSLVEAGLGVGLVPRLSLPAQHAEVVGIALQAAVQRQIGVMVRHGATLKPVPRLALDTLLESLKNEARAVRT